MLRDLLESQDEDSGPILPASVEHHPTRVIHTNDGRVFSDISVTFKRSDVERMRQGYACLQCWEKVETPFPDVCPVCTYPMADRQASDFACDFEGVQWVGSRVDYENEMDGLRDWDARDRHYPGTQILVPHSV